MVPKPYRSSGTLVLFSAAAMLAGGASLSPAVAADIGGNCCADLEERVAELEATVARKGNRRVSLTLSGQVSTAVMAWDAGGSIAPQAAVPDSIGPPTGFANIVPGTGDGGQVVGAGDAGHIDPKHVHLDHSHALIKGKAATPGGRASDVYVVDNAVSTTFFALAGNAKINPNVTAGFNITVSLDTGARSHQVSQFDDDGQAAPAGGGDTTIVMTLANWYVDHKELGRVTVGRINTATAGATTVDLGGAGVIANASIGYWQRSFTDPESGQTWANILGGNTVNGASLARANAVSYTSPTFGGFSLSAAWGENDVWDTALRYAGEFSGFRVAGAIGYVNNSSGLGDVSEESGVTEGGPEPSQWKGSASVLHVATGLYLTGAYVNQDNDTAGRPDTTLWYVQGGMAKNWTGLGNTVVYGEYAQVDDGLANFGLDANFQGSEANVWGLGVVQHIDAAAMEMFLAYRNYSAEARYKDFNDFDVVMGGARIKF